jgi:hypothetical protein
VKPMTAQYGAPTCMALRSDPVEATFTKQFTCAMRGRPDGGALRWLVRIVVRCRNRPLLGDCERYKIIDVAHNSVSQVGQSLDLLLLH